MCARRYAKAKEEKALSLSDETHSECNVLKCTAATSMQLEGVHILSTFLIAEVKA